MTTLRLVRGFFGRSFAAVCSNMAPSLMVFVAASSVAAVARADTTEDEKKCRAGSDSMAFIEALRSDLRTRPERWENPTLESFLGALASWAEDMEGYYKNQGRSAPQSPTWKTVAEMLAAARVYE